MWRGEGKGRNKEGEKKERERDEKGMGRRDRVYAWTHYISNGPSCALPV